MANAERSAGRPTEKAATPERRMQITPSGVLFAPETRGHLLGGKNTLSEVNADLLNSSLGAAQVDANAQLGKNLRGLRT